MRRRTKIAIIGGGIAGLAAALALFRRGIEVAVYEQAGEIVRDRRRRADDPEHDEGAVCPRPGTGGDARRVRAGRPGPAQLEERPADHQYAARQVLYPDGTAHRVAWLYGYDVMEEEHYRMAAAA